MPSFSDPRLVCRPALPSDTDDVLEFTKLIWEGHDYIKYVWREWLDDPQGLLAAAQYGLHTVGIAKVTLLSPGQWWLEGLRVDPQYQGLKVGSHLHEYTDHWWSSHGDGVIRLMTSSERVQVHHLSERTGYTKVGEVAKYCSQDSEGLGGHPVKQVGPAQGESAFEPVAADRLGSVLEFASSHLSHSNGLMDSGWRFSTPDQATLQDSARRGHLHWWDNRQGLLATFEDEEDGARILSISFAAIAQTASLSGLLRDTIDLAREKRFAAVHWLAPVESGVQAALREAGYVLEWEGTGYLYAKSHPSA